MKSLVKKSAFAAMGLTFAAVVAFVFASQDSNRDVGFFYLVFAAAFFLLNFLLYLPASKLKRRAAKGTAVALVAVINTALALGGSVYYLQGKILFQPNNSVECFQQIKAEKTNAPIRITAKDGTQLSGWLRFNTEAKNAPLLLYFGGNGQNSSKVFSGFEKQGSFGKLAGFNMMMVDYRGYGYSQGTLSDAAMFSDALDVYDYAAKQPYADTSKIAVMGYSIGTGAATYLASQRNTAGLILVAPYYDGHELYNGMLNIFHGPLAYLIRYPFDTERYAPQVKCSPLVFTSKKDGMIGWRQSEALSKRFPKLDRLEYVDGATHNTYFGKKKVFDDIQRYLTKIGEGIK